MSCADGLVFSPLFAQVNYGPKIEHTTGNIHDNKARKE
jgi:hypothetical protein